ncbi:hypothetical protein V2G26_016978 [Clonostachys chloroleuca]
MRSRCHKTCLVREETTTDQDTASNLGDVCLDVTTSAQRAPVSQLLWVSAAEMKPERSPSCPSIILCSRMTIAYDPIVTLSSHLHCRGTRNLGKVEALLQTS